jgi:hypothetical protein
VGRWWGQGIGGLTQFKNCVHMYGNVKMIAVETIPGIGGGRIKESGGGG